MEKRSKTMIVATVFLLFLLIMKSTLIDPIGELSGDMDKYKSYMSQTAPFSGGILEKAGLLTYRIVKVKQDGTEGRTEILLKDKDEQWTNHTLEGTYSGKARAYLFYFLPIKDINFKGGVMDNGN